MTQQPNGIHHLAFMAADIKKHIAFFSQVMGCPLVALFDMHGVPGVTQRSRMRRYRSGSTAPNCIGGTFSLGFSSCW